MVKATTKLAAFEIATREDVTCATEIEIRARLLLRTDGLILAVDEVPIKNVIETVVGESLTVHPRGEVKEVNK